MQRTLLTLAAALAVVTSARADTITVNLSSDTVDIDYFTGTIADLPGPDGRVSFPEALIAANNTPGHDRVEFAIPQNEWQLQFLYPGRAVIVGGNLRSFDEITIDGTTQTAFTGDTNPDGCEVAVYGATIYLNAPNSTLIGFDAAPIQVSGSNGIVRDNTNVNVTVFGGSGSLIENNVGGTIKIDRSNDNVVVGNTVQRVRVLGGGSSQLVTGNRVGGPTLAERNHITGYGTWNSEGYPSGATVQLAWNQNTLIENNWIGTTPDGLAQGNLASVAGISFETENHDVVVRDNRIAGILGHGQGPHAAGLLFGSALYFWGDTSNVQILNNTVGLDANGDPTLGSVYGANVDNFAGYSPQGVSFVGNEIAGHIFSGVRVAPTGTFRLSANSIHDNGGLGIDLIPSSFATGVSANDPLDADTGGNGVQNYPVVASATLEGGGVHVVGTLDSAPFSDYTIELFASPACDSSGFGEGSVFLGATSVTTDAAGMASFDEVVGTGAPAGWQVTATATLEPLGATSELSACVELQGGAATAFCGDMEAKSACPCGNVGLPGRGCDNAQGTGGVELTATGDPAQNDVVLTGTGYPTNGAPAAIVIRSQAAETSPIVFGDGLRCISVTGLVRFGASFAAQGTSTHPVSHGAGPGTFVYQLWYRNNPMGFCDGSAAFNLSNGLELTWPQ